MDNSISLDVSKEVYSERRIVKNNQENVDGHQNLTQMQEMESRNHHQQYMGKMVILSKKLNIFLGPNYIFFIIGFCMVLAVSLILVYCSFALIKNQQHPGIFHEIRKVIIAYIITAFSDPGVYKPGKIFIKQTENLRNCSACKVKIPDNVRHCFTCDICIIDMDHHCPWMSKCVAKGNIKAFYAFIGGMFVMVAFFWLNVFLILTQ